MPSRLTTGGAIGAQTALKLGDCPARIDEWAAAALGVNPEILVLAHGGPVAEPADAAFIMKHTRKVSRLLWSFLDGAASGGAGADGTGSKIQGDRRALSAGYGGRHMSGIFVGELILWLIVALIVIVVAVYIVNWLYHRSSKEVSFVRTGFLGEQVVINGGAFVLPFIHDFTRST